MVVTDITTKRLEGEQLEAGMFTKSIRVTEPATASHLFFFFLPINIFCFLPFCLLLYSLLFILPCFLSLAPSLSPPSHHHSCLSLAVDYFWSAWLISVGSQAQCQGKWSAYKKAKRQTDFKKLLMFFQHLSKMQHWSFACYISACACISFGSTFAFG